MSVYVFSGPTLSAEAARCELDAIYLPPVAQGDVYRVARLRPLAIGIVDGYFERLPAVWHKEILWAMAQGVHVYGSASMGALRAAELAAFGMEGVGAIFEAYRDGRLEDDDEVVVAHGPAEGGYRTLSEAMVNIRRTLADAEAGGVIGGETRRALERIAKELFYPERSYPLILGRAAERGLPVAELDALRAWLPSGRADQKREDALAMLRSMRAALADGPAPKRVRYTFEHTHFWELASVAGGELVLDGEGGPESVPLEDLLEEARLDGEVYARARERALLRALAVADAKRQGVTVGAEAGRRALEELRRARGLYEPAELERWLAEQLLSREQLEALVQDEALLAWAAGWAAEEVVRRLPDALRLSGDFGRLLARARDKQRTLAGRGLENPSLADTGLSRDELLDWYAGRLGRPIQTDLGSHARVLGFEDREMFVRALAREYCYIRARGEGGGDDTLAAPLRRPDRG